MKAKNLADFIGARLLSARKFLLWWIIPAKEYVEICDQVMRVLLANEQAAQHPIHRTAGNQVPKLASMVNSLANMLIDSSSKGYTSSNDLDFANECIEKVVHLLEPNTADANVGYMKIEKEDVLLCLTLVAILIVLLTLIYFFPWLAIDHCEEIQQCCGALCI